MDKTTKRLSKVCKGLSKDIKRLIFLYSDKGLELCKMDKSTPINLLKFKILYNLYYTIFLIKDKCMSGLEFRHRTSAYSNEDWYDKYHNMEELRKKTWSYKIFGK